MFYRNRVGYYYAAIRLAKSNFSKFLTVLRVYHERGVFYGSRSSKNRVHHAMFMECINFLKVTSSIGNYSSVITVRNAANFMIVDEACVVLPTFAQLQ